MAEFDYNKRIVALERIITTLAAEIDLQRPVVEAAQARVSSLRKIHPDGLTRDEIDLVAAIAAYETAKAEQVKGATNGRT